MSFYQSVWLELPCERCGIVRETAVRFHGERRDDTDYKLGERVVEGVDLNRGENYEGNADRFCWSCLCKWTYSQVEAEYESLAGLVLQRRLIIRENEAGIPLSSDQVLEYGRRYINHLKETGYPTAPLTANFKDLFLVWNGQSALASSDAYGDLLNTLEPLVSERLRRAGWSNGTEHAKDFRVFLDSESRIMVEEVNNVGRTAV
jgi:hypothetical protein